MTAVILAAGKSGRDYPPNGKPKCLHHIAGRAAVTMSPVKRYAGLKLAKGWIGIGEAFPVQLGVVQHAILRRTP